MKRHYSISNKALLELLAEGLDQYDGDPGPYQALAAARGGPDNSLLTERGIMGIFFDALESTFDETWASRVGIMIPADAESITHRWIGQTPGLRQWVGGLLAKGANVQGITITNADYEATLEISTHDKRRDKTGGILRRIGELAMRANNHWEELMVTSLEANPTCYDGQSYFSPSHASGDSGTQDNVMTSADLPGLDVTTPTRPTREEAAVIMTQAAAQFYNYKDDKGKKTNQGARNFLILCPPNMSVGFEQAIRQQLEVTGGSPRAQSLRWSFEVAPEALLSSTTVMYFFRTDGLSSKPYILQTEVDPHLIVIGPDSEHAKKNNSELYSLRTTRNVGPGEWRHALQCTLS